MKQKDTWSTIVNSKPALITAVVSVAVFTFSMWSYSSFLTGIEARLGVRIPDPLLGLFTPTDLSWLIFISVWGSVVIAFVGLVRSPQRLFHIMRAYTILIAIRIICMWLLPLEPPDGIIVLVDPIAKFFGAGAAQPLTKDLFFSGHMAMLCLLAFMFEEKPFKFFFGTLAIVVGLAVLMQHVHYSIDVMVAPLAAMAAVRLSKKS
ncbi:MAG: phosphatase PAP2 family protein [Ignavibacteria bacterium]|nr:phosphatase PAP2 family protein [Ignavibacteria bacterium]